MSKIIINEFYRGSTLTTGDEFIELLLVEDLTATELNSFFVGDSTGSKATKFAAYDFINMESIASTFRAGTIIAVGGTARFAQDTSYDPTAGDWNIFLNAGGAFLPSVGSGGGDIAADDIVWVDTASTGSTISVDGFAVEIGTGGGAFVAAANVNFGSSTNNTGYALNSDLAGATNTANWIVNIPSGSTTPGLANGGANTTYTESLRTVAPPLGPTVTITASPNSTTEGSLISGLFTITRTGETTNPLTVNFTTGGTATSGDDYLTPDSFTTNSIVIPAGQSSVSIAISAIDDTIVEPVETVTITLSPSAGYTVGTGNTATASINDNDIAVSKIHQIQGSGLTFNTTFGGTQTIEGIVVGAFLGSSGLSGFYVQEEDADWDDNPLTSEGIFVFDPTGLFSGNVGDKVRVTGLAAEFASSTSTGTITGTNLSSSLTQISLANSVNGRNVVNLGASTLPSITNVTIPVTDASELERFEGMLVNVSAATGPLTVTNNFTLARFGQVGLSAGGRLDQYTQTNAPSVDGYTEYFNNLLDNYIILDDGSNTQNPATVIHARNGQPLSATNTLRGGDTIASITGVLDQRFEGYRVQTRTPANFTAANPREEVAPEVGGTLKVASFNLLNFFNGDGSGGGFPTSRGADNLTEYNRQLAKTVEAILGLDADVIGYNEMENDGFGSTSAVQQLEDALNARTAPGTYAFVTPPSSALNSDGGFGGDEITVGFIYKTSAVRLAPGTSVAALTTGIFAQDDANRVQRPALAATFERLDSLGATGETFTAVINHFKSKGSPANLPGDADQGDGQGLSNETRTRASQELAAWLATNPTGTSDPDVLIMGDLNAYRFEDPITTLESAGYTSLFDSNTYSFQFRAQWGSLDHALVTGSLVDQVTGAAKWHINADEPGALNYNLEFKSTTQQSSFYNVDPFASSDHDPLVVGLNLTPTNQAPTAVGFANAIASLAESFSTTARIKMADVTITDDGRGTNVLSLSGTDASFFELDGNALFLKAGTAIDFETKSSYAVTVNVDDAEVGASPDASNTFNLTITDVAEINLRFGQRLARLTMQTFQDNVLIGEAQGSQNGVAPSVDPFTLFAIDSADSGRRANFVDRTWLDQGEGIGIADGDDGNSGARKRIDGDELLGIRVAGFEAKDALVNVDRITFDDDTSISAIIQVQALRNGAVIDSEVFNLGAVSRRNIQTLNFSSEGFFDTLYVSAVGDTQFTFRSVELPQAFAV